jgi:hypothetical protein
MAAAAVPVRDCGEHHAQAAAAQGRGTGRQIGRHDARQSRQSGCAMRIAPRPEIIPELGVNRFGRRRERLMREIDGLGQRRAERPICQMRELGRQVFGS